LERFKSLVPPASDQAVLSHAEKSLRMIAQYTFDLGQFSRCFTGGRAAPSSQLAYAGGFTTNRGTAGTALSLARSMRYRYLIRCGWCSALLAAASSRRPALPANGRDAADGPARVVTPRSRSITIL